jgi:hypothetical protein
VAMEAPAGAARAALERKRLGLDHAAAGGLLVGLSDPADDVVRAISYHHGGPTGLAVPSAEAACVIVGDAVAHLLSGNEIDRDLLGVALEKLGAGPDLLDEVAERAGVAATGATGDLAEAVGRLEAVAHTDDLTGLRNRRSWIDHVSRELAAGHEGALLICDIDGFKAVNERHGHRAGDLLLSEVARVLARHGVAGRLGGDEFGVWVEEGGDAGERAAKAIAGVAVAGAGADVMELMERADRELSAIKPGGRRAR